MIFPNAVKSGTTLVRPCAPRKPKRSQVMTSSKIKSAPARWGMFGEALQESAGGLHETHVGPDRLDDYRGEFGLVSFEPFVDRGEVVVARDEHVVPDPFWNSRRLGTGRGAGIDQREIEMAVVVSGKLEDARAPGKRARNADRAHHRFGAGRDEAEALH